MESPGSWSFITAALAVASHDDVDQTWMFLVEVGAIANRADVREALEEAIGHVKREGEVTGPSRAARVAARLLQAGGVTTTGIMPDPNGDRAKQAFAAAIASGLTLKPYVQPIFDEAYCRHCGQKTSLSYSQIHRCQHCGKDPVDIIALVIELGYSSRTHRRCPVCGRASCFDHFCYYCGHSFDG